MHSSNRSVVQADGGGPPRNAPPGSVVIGDIQVSDLLFEEAVRLLTAWGLERSGGYVCTPNVDHVVQAHRSRPFRSAVAGARLRVPDGMGIVYASHIAGRPLRGTVTGRLLVSPLCDALWAAGHRVAFFGGRGDVAQEALDVVAARLGVEPRGLAITPQYPIDIGSAADHEHVAKLRACDPSVVFVALGAPRQELWMQSHAAALPGSLMVGIGAAFDVIARRRYEAPRWMTKVGLEWLFRLAQEPRRLWTRYLRDDPWVFWWAIRARMGRRP